MHQLMQRSGLKFGLMLMEKSWQDQRQSLILPKMHALLMQTALIQRLSRMGRQSHIITHVVPLLKLKDPTGIQSGKPSTTRESWIYQTKLLPSPQMMLERQLRQLNSKRWLQPVRNNASTLKCVTLTLQSKTNKQFISVQQLEFSPPSQLPCLL